MKSYIRSLLLSLVLSGFTYPLTAQESANEITRTLSFSNPDGTGVLAVENINGAIKVEGYSGEDIQLRANRTIVAEDDATLERMKDQVELGIMRREDSLIIYIKGPFDHHLGKNGRINYHLNSWQEGYDFRFDFTIKVPRETNLLLSTVNKGDIEVTRVHGKLRLYNINGAIRMDQVSGSLTASTINGNVEATYGTGRLYPSSYKTLNGDVTISYPSDLSADLTFKNANGDFYTNFPVAEYLPAKVEINKSGRKDRTTYKIENNPVIRIGGGGPGLYFETINGDITVKSTRKGSGKK